VEIFQFDRGERLVRIHDSIGLHATRIAAGHGPVRLVCLRLDPGGVVGTHPAGAAQLFLVVAGDGWIAGPDGERVPITSGWSGQPPWLPIRCPTRKVTPMAIPPRASWRRPELRAGRPVSRPTTIPPLISAIAVRTRDTQRTDTPTR
jgi:hypothetical protein